MATMNNQPWRQLGLSDEEYERIRVDLGREPNLVELNMYSVMWSEHCSYKHSRAMLRLLPVEGPQVLQGPGENAGVVDLGGGLAAAFKIESHNHPTAVEPFQGAATGAGGIIRDIVAMGARPAALLGSLRFGPLEEKRSRFLFEGAVAGMRWYAAGTEIPFLSAELFFEDCYRGNPLANVMCVGLLPAAQLMRGLAAGEGNVLLLAGAPTGREGIHGVTFASEQFAAEMEDEAHEPVQVGDAAMGKALLEATLEVIENGLVLGVQDLGGAGLSCALTETAARAGSGMEVELERVPLREEDEGMNAYEILTSETQERMLLIVAPAQQQQVAAAYVKRGLCCSAVGKVTGGGLVVVKHRGEAVARVPAKSVAEGAPVYEPASREPEYYRRLAALDPMKAAPAGDLNEIFLKVFGTADVAGWAWAPQCGEGAQVKAGGEGGGAGRSGTEAGGKAHVRSGGGTAVLLPLPGHKGALAVAVAGNGRLVYLDPYRGSVFALCQAVRELACVGAKPLGITDGLNFGNPENPEVFWQFRRAVEGIAAACRALDLPVVGGNVSFYNEVAGEAIYPTPVIGAVGLLEDAAAAERIRCGFAGEGDVLYLLGPAEVSLGGSQYQKVLHGAAAGALPDIDLELERRLHDLLRRLVKDGLICGAGSLSLGGLATALGGLCLQEGCGAEIELPAQARPEMPLFGEGPTRVLLRAREADCAGLEALAKAAAVEILLLGRCGGERLRISAGGEPLVDLPLEQLQNVYRGAIPCPAP